MGALRSNVPLYCSILDARQSLSSSSRVSPKASAIRRYVPGEVCVCSPNTPIEDGDAVYVRFGAERDSECTFKRVYDLQDGRVELRADNTNYKPLIARKEHIVRMSYVAAKITRFDRRKRGAF